MYMYSCILNEQPTEAFLREIKTLASRSLYCSRNIYMYESLCLQLQTRGDNP